MGPFAAQSLGPFDLSNIQLSHGPKTRGPLLSMKYWMVIRDPYFMVYDIIPI